MQINNPQFKTFIGVKALFSKNGEEVPATQANTQSEEPGAKTETITKTLSEALEFFTSYENNYEKKSEKFDDVRAEMGKNVPDSTSTIEEKKLAISYIDRMLACDDITPELKNYWSNKKNIIEMEIQSIKNEQQAGKTEKWEDVTQEFSDFTEKYWVENVLNDKAGIDNLEFNDANEYYNTVRRTMITYCDRLLACSDLPDDKRESYTNLRNGFKCDLNYYAAQANVYNEQNSIKTESFNDILDEFNRNIPDSTSTINDKYLAVSYIERMLTCDDITPELKNYWSNKKDIIEMEIQNIRNEEKIGTGESINDVANEWKEFTDLYWNKTPEFNNTADRVEYYESYYNTYISFCDRALACSDLLDEDCAEWTRMKQNAISDLNYHNRDLNRYNKENNIKTESFNDVLKEFEANVPDSTTTANEKNLALSYIDRMLACDDITSENENYWSNKKDVIEMETQNIKNEEETGTGESIKDVEKEWKECINKYWNKNKKFDNTEDRVEYYRKYYNMNISFCNRALTCSDITEEDRMEWTRMKINAIRGLNCDNRDLSIYNAKKGIKTEFFYNVFKEFNANVPDSTTTADEKKLALSYIERMLVCDDIPKSMRLYWSNKEATIQKELKQLK